LPCSTNFKGYNLSRKKWTDCIWGDYHDDKDSFVVPSRPARYRNDFDKSMRSYKCNLLIKGHNPFAPITMYDNRCITIQTNRAYNETCGIHLVIIDLDKPITDADDVEIINLNQILQQGVE
jgi:hypothetical protein